jgi:hypothetical protein
MAPKKLEKKVRKEDVLIHRCVVSVLIHIFVVSVQLSPFGVLRKCE